MALPCFKVSVKTIIYYRLGGCVFNWLKRVFSVQEEVHRFKCVYDTTYLEERTIALINDIEEKANLVFDRYSDNTDHKSYKFSHEILNVTIPILVKSYEQTCIAGERDKVCERLGRYPVVMFNDTLRALIECFEDILQGDVILFQKPALTHSVQNIIQIEDILQKRVYEENP